MGYAQAACVIWHSTQTTAPEPSTVAAIPGNFGCLIWALPTPSSTSALDIDTLTLPPFRDLIGLPAARAALLGSVLHGGHALFLRLHVRDHVPHETVAAFLHVVDREFEVVLVGELFQLTHDVRQLAIQPAMLERHRLAELLEAGGELGDRRQQAALFHREVVRYFRRQRARYVLRAVQAGEVGE